MKKRIAGLFLICLVGALGAQYDQVDTEELKQIVVSRGQLAFTQPVPVRFLGEEEYRSRLADHYKERFPADSVAKGELFLKLMGFVPGNFDLKALYRKVYGEKVRSFYSPASQTIIASGRQSMDTYFNRMHLAYSLRNALWDQHSMSRTHPGYVASAVDDRRLALLSALRGDSTYFMLEAVDFSPDLMRGSDHPDTLVSYLPLSGIFPSPGIPDQVKAILGMSYLKGLDFVTYLYEGVKSQRKRTRRIADLLENPPVATAQILHPEKYLEGWQPVSVPINYTPPDYSLVENGVVGEYLLGRMVDSRDIEKGFLSEWEGDSFRIYRKGEELIFLIFQSQWQTPGGAEKMAARMRLYLTRRFQVRFRTGEEQRFIAGRGGDHYYFLHRNNLRLLHVNTNDREAINLFINGGQYD